MKNQSPQAGLSGNKSFAFFAILASRNSTINTHRPTRTPTRTHHRVVWAGRCTSSPTRNVEFVLCILVEDFFERALLVCIQCRPCLGNSHSSCTCGRKICFQTSRLGVIDSSIIRASSALATIGLGCSTIMPPRRTVPKPNTNQSQRFFFQGIPREGHPQGGAASTKPFRLRG